MNNESRHWTHPERLAGAVAVDSLRVRRIVAAAPREGWRDWLRRVARMVSEFLGAK